MPRFAGYFSLLAVALLGGCVSVQEISLAPTAAEGLRGRITTVATRERPDFSAFTPGRAAIGGLIGGAMMIELGNRVVRENDIEDPSLAIARALGAELGARYALQLAGDTVRIDSDEVAQLAKSHPQVDLLLDVRTLGWMYAYFPTAWNRYWVGYSARLRLIDLKRAQVVAEGGCTRKPPDDSTNAPTGDELLANGAQRLKSELATAAEFCLQQFRTATFALAGPAPSLAMAAPASQTAMAAPPAGVVPFQSGSPLPKEGDTWTYRLNEPKRASGPKQRKYEAKVTAASATEIVERYSIEEGPSGERKHSSGAYLVGLGASVFSPYLAAFRDLSAQPALGAIEVDDPVCRRAASCDATARVVGREVVIVPAGKFETIKIKVEHGWRGWRGRAQGGRELYVWYAPAVKRAVKFSSRLTAGLPPSFEADFDLELLSYQLR